jgi:UDP-3-O-[3-hydroxymyristoyl] glucosamine N-acyltransferase
LDLWCRGNGKETFWLLRDCQHDFIVNGFIDDYKCQSKYEQLPLINEPNFEDYVVIAIANSNQRKNIVYNKINLKFLNVIHPNVKINSTVQIGLGNIFCDGVIFTTNIKVGNHVIININSIIGHDSILEDYVSNNV